MTVGSALYFNGIANKVTVGHNAMFMFGSGTIPAPFSVECWEKIGSLVGDNIIAKERATDSTYAWFINNGAGSPCFYVSRVGAANYMAQGKGIDDGNWHHICGVRSGGGLLQIYIDGSVFNGDTQNAAITNTGSVTFAYSERFDYFNPVSGLDEVRIWNKALTAGSIATLYNSGAGFYGGSETGLILGFHFDVSGTNETDYSGMGNTGSINATWIGGIVSLPEGATTGNYYYSGGEANQTWHTAGILPSTWSSTTDKFDRKANINIFASTLALGAQVKSTTVLSDARIVGKSNQTILSDIRIKQSNSQIINSNSRIKQLNSQTILSSSRIKASSSYTITSDVRIQTIAGTNSYEIFSSARVMGNASAIILSDSRVKQLNSTTLLSNAGIQKSSSTTVTSDSRIKSSPSQTITSDGRVMKLSSSSILSNTRIKQINSITINSNSRIGSKPSQTILSDSRVKKFSSQTITSSSSVVIINSTIILSDATIYTPPAAPGKRILARVVDDRMMSRISTERILTASLDP